MNGNNRGAAGDGADDGVPADRLGVAGEGIGEATGGRAGRRADEAEPGPPAGETRPDDAAVAGGAFGHSRPRLSEDDLARVFERERPRLLRVGYSITGSLAEAEDCVQDAWLRLRGMDDPSRIRDVPAWLTTTVGRLALDVLGSARVRRERYVGTWLPEPLVEETAQDPADRAGVQAGSLIAGNDYREDYTLPGTQSRRAADLLAAHGAARAADTVPIVMAVGTEKDAGPATGLRDEAVRARITAMAAHVAGMAEVAEVRTPYDGPSAVSGDGRIGYATVVLAVPAKEMSKADAERLHAAAESFAGDGLRIELGGDVGRLLAAGEGGIAEGAGLLAALVILVVMFGTVLAAGLPIITAVFAVGSTLAVVTLASHVFTIADWTPYVMMLVGLGVGIDYALLIFARFRSELLRGRSPRDATVVALDAAGRSVFVAGCTVIVALCGLVVLGLGSLRGMALPVALTVLVTMLASLTLLPALLAVFGDRFARTFRVKAERRARRGRTGGGAVWRRLAAVVQRRPLIALASGLPALGALTLPVLDLRLGFADAGNDAPGKTGREAYDLLSEGFGPGFNGPLVVVTEGGHGGAVPATDTPAAALQGVRGVAAVGPVTPVGDGTVATVLVFPEGAPQDEETSSLVTRLRDHVLPGLAADTGATYPSAGPPRRRGTTRTRWRYGCRCS